MDLSGIRYACQPETPLVRFPGDLDLCQDIPHIKRAYRKDDKVSKCEILVQISKERKLKDSNIEW